MTDLITLITSDNKTIQAPKNVVELNTIIKELIDDISDESIPIPVPNVEERILNLVIDFCKQHVNDPIEKEKDEDAEYLDEDEDKDENEDENDKMEEKSWDDQFCESQKIEDIFHLLNAANYLNNKKLLDLLIKYVANLIKGKTRDEICELFGVENDFTPEEEEAIRKEYGWLEECDED